MTATANAFSAGVIDPRRKQGATVHVAVESDVPAMVVGLQMWARELCHPENGNHIIYVLRPDEPGWKGGSPNTVRDPELKIEHGSENRTICLSNPGTAVCISMADSIGLDAFITKTRAFFVLLGWETV